MRLTVGIALLTMFAGCGKGEPPPKYPRLVGGSEAVIFNEEYRAVSMWTAEGDWDVLEVGSTVMVMADKGDAEEDGRKVTVICKEGNRPNCPVLVSRRSLRAR